MRPFIFTILILSLSLSFALSARAAEISFEAQSNQIGVGDELQITLFLNAEKEEINALEGLITFPQELLELKEIRDGNSFINFWIERPKIETGGKIVFSGITPGGYKSDKGFIFSIIFQAKKQGVGTINFEGVRILKNDGQGTNASLKISNFQFLISKQIPTAQSPISEIKDIESPELFVPEIARDPNIFDGQWFLVFATQDKKSGIDHYEVREGVWGWYRNAESSYLLKHQQLDRKIYVKAIDKAGNERIVKLEPRNPLAWYENYKNWIITIIAVAAFFAIKFRLWTKLKKA